MNLPHNALVLVADGRKMLLLRNDGNPAQPSLRVEAHDTHIAAADRYLKTDAAGQASSSPVGGNAQETDYHQQVEDRFTAQVAALLNKKALESDFDALVVAAPPHVLGELRKLYHKETQSRLTGEIAKDLTGHPVPRIEQALALA